jgi:hypothetical protein
MTVISDATDAGVLISHGLAARNPVDGSDYERIYERYRTDQFFRELVDAIAAGLGLSVVGAPPTGIVLAGQAGSPFAFRLSDLGLSTEEQQLFGLVLLGVAALAYPTEQHLDTTSAQIISVERVERFLRSSITSIKSIEPVDGSIETWTISAAAAYERRPAFIPTAVEKRAAKGCTQKTIETVFDWLVRQKMARVAGRAYGPGRYLLTDRFRIMVAELAGSDALEVLRTRGRKERARDGEVSP